MKNKRGAPKGALPVLGVGLPYMAELPVEFYDPSLIDFIELTPETLCREILDNGNSRIIPVPELLLPLQELCAHMPMVVHGVELSIGSACGWNQAYINMLDEFQTAFPFPWHSEHLSFQTIKGENDEIIEIGIPLPLPPSEEAAAMVAERCAIIVERYGVPFLLENPVHYLASLPGDANIGDEFTMMNRICAQSGCGMLLDLHNVYCNAVNHGFDAWKAVQRLSLEHVLEIHVSGGRAQDGYWTDAHEGRVPDPVWRLLEQTLPLCQNISAVVFEIFPVYIPTIGPEGIRDELKTARDIWNLHQHRH